MGSESTANHINPSQSGAFLRREPLAPDHSGHEGKVATVEKTVLDEFRSQLLKLENLQARVNFMTSEVQSLIRK